MRPLLLKGHERSITSLKYNFHGDLLFTTSKHLSFAVWYSETGERIGTYSGHNGAIYSVDVDRLSERVISGSADTYAKLWQVETGKEITQWTHKAPVRSVNYSCGENRFLTVTDNVFGFMPTICIFDLASDSRTTKPVMEITGRNEAKILSAMWGSLNENVITACEDGTIRVYDIRNGEQVKVITDHSKAVMSLQYNKNKTMFVSASKDGSARLYDAKTFKLLKTYTTGRPVNSASISPLEDYEIVILGGGQSAESVTTTRVESTQFRVRFYHLIYADELASVHGHFGPVNVVSYSPDGKGFASGGEDGYVRVHHFDKSYFSDFSKDAFVNRKKGSAPLDLSTRQKEEEDDEEDDL